MNSFHDKRSHMGEESIRSNGIYYGLSKYTNENEIFKLQERSLELMTSCLTKL